MNSMFLGCALFSCLFAFFLTQAVHSDRPALRYTVLVDLPAVLLPIDAALARSTHHRCDPSSPTGCAAQRPNDVVDR